MGVGDEFWSRDWQSEIGEELTQCTGGLLGVLGTEG
jgi:hypothetical protein